ncbi:hypothetical protein [Catenovulum sediminis]|uniref:Bacterial OB-fold domain-containing protein n=1 Tax=Catenovulum sediminis TaxID=1740262 RepID=A0ABV1RHL1_9ALTE
MGVCFAVSSSDLAHEDVLQSVIDKQYVYGKAITISGFLKTSNTGFGVFNYLYGSAEKLNQGSLTNVILVSGQYIFMGDCNKRHVVIKGLLSIQPNVPAVIYDVELISVLDEELANQKQTCFE